MSVTLAVIVPVYNEAGNIATLVKRVDQTLKNAEISYHLYIVDDRSTDNTTDIIKSLISQFPLTLINKQGKPGKAYSILEAVAQTDAPYLAMIDADLQYPPESLPTMLELAQSTGVCVAHRRENEASKARRFISKSFQWFFGKMLHGLDCDVQSGLKVFKREILEAVNPRHITPWTLDIPLLTQALHQGYSISQVDITFKKRTQGYSKIRYFSSISEIGSQAIRHKFIRKQPVTIPPLKTPSMIGAGLAHKGHRFVTHTTLSHHQSALRVVTKRQKIFLLSILLLFITSLLSFPLETAVFIVAVLSAIYFLDVIFNLFLITKSLHQPPEITLTKEELNHLPYQNLPVYTILCPLYREAHVIPQFIEAIDALDWPKKKLDVKLLLELDDYESQEAVKHLKLPSYVSVVLVPESQPKTKPKACNYGLNLARGEYVVIYDAEDKPDPLQLKKSYLAFQKVGPRVACLQAKLNYYNPHQNWLTRLFTAEYSLWFDITLTGLQSIGTSIPLGGTSNHFRTHALLDLQGWDPFNVTEDCDLGVRLFSQGYKTAIFDSLTLEEANSNVKNWLRQRSRWIKGYMQTYLLHMRSPRQLVKKQGIHSLIFQLVVGGKIAFILINPILWLLTIAYFTMYASVGPTIESLYPAPVFYMAVISLIFGNFMFIYYYMIGCAKREYWSLMKWIFLVPVYWLMVSLAGFMALYQLVVKPHYWEKTIHGLHLIKNKPALPVVTQSEVPNLASRKNWHRDVLKSEEISDFHSIFISARSLTKWKQLGHHLIRGKYQSGTILVAAAMTANILNMLVNLYLGQELRVTDFAVFSIYASILSIVVIFSSAFSATVNHKTAILFGRYQKHSLSAFWVRLKNNTLIISLILSMLWILLVPILSAFFQLPNYLPLFMFVPVILVSGPMAVNTGYLRGLLAFRLLAVITLVDAGTRLITSIFFGELRLDYIAYLSIPISVVVAAIISHIYSKTEKVSLKKPAPLVSNDYHLQRKFFFTSVLSNLSGVAFFSLDVLLVAHYLSAYETGLYAIMGLLGKIIFFTGSLIIGFILPITAYQQGKGITSNKTFNKLFLLSIFISTCAWLVVGLFIPLLAPLFLGVKINAVRQFLPIYTLGILFYTISQAIVKFRLARKDYLFPTTSFIIALFQILLLVIFHQNLTQVTWVMFISGFLNFILIFVFHFFYRKIRVPYHNVGDFLDLLFGKLALNGVAVSPLLSHPNRILIFNWRDSRHVWAGGAEVYIHNIAKGLIQNGHKVTLFCGNDGKCPRNEIIEGVKIIRRGGFFTVYIWAALYYLFKLRKHFDLIIDSENGIPFLTPFYVRKPIFLLVHHIHQDVFRTQLRFPLSNLAAFIEGVVMPVAYQRHSILTVSSSSKKEIIKLGLGDRQSITIIHPGVTLAQFKTTKKTLSPSLVYIGRLKSYKNVDVAIKAFIQILPNYPKAKFYIAGKGESERSLKTLVKSHDLDKSVLFLGKIDDATKASLLAKSWVAVQPSMIEGWGITVIEANACGTPVVASDVKGLRDSVQTDITGLLVTPNDVSAFAGAITRLFKNKAQRNAMSHAALEWSQNFYWENSHEKLNTLIMQKANVSGGTVVNPKNKNILIET